MAAAKKPLEFHAQRPWVPDGRIEDSDEDDEEDNEAENGFSMEEVLRLGGTKVMGWNPRRRGSGRGEWARAWPRSCGAGGRPGPGSQLRKVLRALPAPLLFRCSLQDKLELSVFMPSPQNVGDPLTSLTKYNGAASGREADFPVLTSRPPCCELPRWWSFGSSPSPGTGSLRTQEPCVFWEFTP